MLLDSNSINIFFAISSALISIFWLYHIVVSKLTKIASYRFICALTGLFMGFFSINNFLKTIDYTSYDDTTPFIIITDFKLITPTVYSGEMAIVEYDYFKRPGCEGNVSYRMKEVNEIAGDIVLQNTMTTWPSGEGKAKAYFSIPKNIKSNDYYLYWFVSGHCKKISDFKASSPTRDIRFKAPLVKVKVINKNNK